MGRGTLMQHVKYISRMAPLRCLLIGLGVILLREMLFTTTKRADAVDMNHGLNLGGIEVIRDVEGMKKGGHGIVW
jgi:hypothetical protein